MENSEEYTRYSEIAREKAKKKATPKVKPKKWRLVLA